VLLYDQAAGIAAMGLIGLIAAAISTSDSQIFALGSELRSLLALEDKKALLITRIFIVVFGGLALVFSIISSDQLVLLARTSFSGTAMMGPMILIGLLSSKKLSRLMPIVTLLVLISYILSKAGVLPAKILVMEIEIFLFLCLAVAACMEIWVLGQLKSDKK
jgi:SSS family solute:Na+ symporter